MKRYTYVLATLLGGVMATQSQVLPVLNQQISDVAVNNTLLSHAIDLDTHFGTEAVDSQVVRFTSNFNDTSGAPIVLDFALFSARTPLTRANFLTYVNSGAYTDALMHRWSPGFVLQGGGFTLPATSISSIATNAPVQNEFGISNTYGTIAMAKLGSSPDSATSQWFVNTGDNSDNLDNQNGGFTVFARLTQDSLADLAILTSASNFTARDISTIVGNGAFTSTPLLNSYTGAGDSLQVGEFIRFPAVTLEPLEASQAGSSTALTYSVISNSNAALVTATAVATSSLNLSLDPTVYGSSSLVVQATDSVGNSVYDTLIVTNPEVTNYADWRLANWTGIDATDEAISGPTADHDSDGRENLVNFAFGLDKEQSSRGLVGIALTASETVDITFPLIKSNSVNYRIQRSLDLGDQDPWVDVSHTESVSRTDLGDTTGVTANVSKPNSTKAFYRIAFDYNE